MKAHTREIIIYVKWHNIWDSKNPKSLKLLTQRQLSKPDKSLHLSQLQPAMHNYFTALLHSNSVLRKKSCRNLFFSINITFGKAYVTWKGKPVAVYKVFWCCFLIPLINFLHSVKDSVLQWLLQGLTLAILWSDMTMQNVQPSLFHIIVHAVLYMALLQTVEIWPNVVIFSSQTSNSLNI